MSLSTIQKDLKKNPELLNKQRLNGENELLFRPEITVEELKFLKSLGLNLKQTSKHFKTVLTCLVAANNLEAVRYLLEEEGFEAVINYSEEGTDRTPIFYAKTVEMLKLLLKHGADPFAMDGNGHMFVHKAWKNEEEDLAILSFLKEYSEEIGEDLLNIKDCDFEETPIYFQDNLEVLKHLVNLGAKIVQEKEIALSQDRKEYTYSLITNKYGASPLNGFDKLHNRKLSEWFEKEVFRLSNGTIEL